MSYKTSITKTLDTNTPEAEELKSTGQPVDKILVTDGADGFTYEDKPAGGGGALSYAKIIQTSNVSISSGTNIKLVTYHSIDEQVGTVFSWNAGSIAVDINEAGLMLFQAGVGFVSTPSSAVGRQLEVWLTRYNSSNAIVDEQFLDGYKAQETTSGVGINLAGSALFNCNVGDYVRVRIFWNGGSSIQTVASDTQNNFIKASKIG